MRSRRTAVALVSLLALAGCSADDPADPAGAPDSATGGSGEGDVIEVPGVALSGDSAAISPTGSRIAVPCDGRLCVWTTADGALSDVWEGGSVVAWSNRADVLATDRVDGPSVSLVLVDAESGEERDAVEAYTAEEDLDAPGAGFADVAFAPDAESVAAAGADGVVRIWSVAGLADEVEIATTDATALAFSADAARIAVASSSAPVRVYDTTSGEQVGELDAPPQGDVAWSQDGAHLATASFALDADAATTVWDADSLEAEATLPRAAYRLAFTAVSDALVLSEKEQTGVAVWTWADEDDFVRVLTGALDVPRAVLAAPDGVQVLAVSPRDGVLAWDLSDTTADNAPTTFDAPER